MLIDLYWKHVDDLYDQVKTNEKEDIIKAGKLIAETVDKGACVHIHDTGHIIDAELIGRGGGLILYKQFKYHLNVDNPVRKRDRSDLDTGMEGLAAYALKASGARPGDVMIIGTVSGRTFSAVDLAFEAKKMSLKIILITSKSYATAVEAVHSSGQKLYEIADVTIDNCAPPTEGMMDVEGMDAKLCAASGLTSAFIMWSITTVTVEELMKLGKTPGVFKSYNAPGGDQYNSSFVRPQYEEKGI